MDLCVYFAVCSAGVVVARSLLVFECFLSSAFLYVLCSLSLPDFFSGSGFGAAPDESPVDGLYRIRFLLLYHAHRRCRAGEC